MKKTLSYFMLAALFLAASCQSAQKKAGQAEEKECCSDKTDACCEVNTLNDDEKSAGWVLLFDGKTSQGWRGVNKDHFPTGWQVVDGALQCVASGKGEAGATDGGDILFDKKFKNFHLKLEWKISEGGNSGIFYLGQEVPEWPIYKTAPEMQVLDNERHVDANMGKDGNRQAGSLYDMIPAKPQNAKPAGEWNSVEIICFKGTVVHKQNGETVLEYHLWTDDWKKMVAESKFPGLNENFANVAEEGYLALQDHGDDVWYRNIKIKEL